MIITANQIKAALLFAAKQGFRYHMNSILLEVTKAGNLLMVTTNGHTMLVIHAGPSNGQPAGQYILRTEDAKVMLATKGTSFDVDIQGGKIAIPDKGLMFTPIDGKYPDWRRVVPAKPEAEVPASYDADYLAACKKAAQLIGNGSYRLYQNGSNSALVAFGEKYAVKPTKARGGNMVLVQALAVVMPMRTADFPVYSLAGL